MYPVDEERNTYGQDDHYDYEESYNKKHGPLVWRRLATGIKITDLQPVNFNEVIDIILKYYLTRSSIFSNTSFLDDLDSIESYKKRLFACMMDHCSIIAVKVVHWKCDRGHNRTGGSHARRMGIAKLRHDFCRSCHDEKEEETMEENDEIVGVLLLKTIKKVDCGRVFSREELSTGKTYASILRFLNALQRKVDIYEQFQCDVYLRYYLLCIKPQYRRHRIGFQMAVCGLDVARHLGILVIMGIMESHKLQNVGRLLSMQVLCEISYRKYQDEDGELIFCDCGIGNNTCAILGGLVPPAPEPEKDHFAQAGKKDAKKKDKAKGGKGKKK